MTKTETPPLERKLVAIMAADVVGYSRLMHDDEERTRATLTANRVIIDGLIANSRGEISGTAGDSVLAEFAIVLDALRCAVSIQQMSPRPTNPCLPRTGCCSASGSM
jgi:adenylate cyclase